MLVCFTSTLRWYAALAASKSPLASASVPWSRACWAATCCGSIVEECGVVDEAKREKARAAGERVAAVARRGEQA